MFGQIKTEDILKKSAKMFQKNNTEKNNNLKRRKTFDKPEYYFP